MNASRIAIAIVMACILMRAHSQDIDIQGCCGTNLEQFFDFPVALSGPITPQQAEALERTKSKLLPGQPAFGRLQQKWEKIESALQQGDCLFHFATAVHARSPLSDREGYIVFRNGVPIASLLVRGS